MSTLQDLIDPARQSIKSLTLQFKFGDHRTGAGRFYRQKNGLYLLEISDRWGTYVCPIRRRLDEIDTPEKAGAICVAAAERERGYGEDHDQPKRKH